METIFSAKHLLHESPGELTQDGYVPASAFALCRPPGHHAGADHYGGYCFLNNAAIAAQKLLDKDVSRIAILDVDYHHGNGTQQIFYARNDVLVVSLHGDPDSEYPFRLGYAAAEIGINTVNVLTGFLG